MDADISWANSVPDNSKNEDKTATTERTETGNGIRVKSISSTNESNKTFTEDVEEYLKEYFGDEYNVGKTTTDIVINETNLEWFYKYLSEGIKNMERPNNIGKGLWAKQVENDLKWIEDYFGKSSIISKVLKSVPAITIGIDTLLGINENIKSNSGAKETVSDAGIDIGMGALEALTSIGVPALVVKLLPTLSGHPVLALIGIAAGLGANYLLDHETYGGEETIKERIDSKF